MDYVLWWMKPVCLKPYTLMQGSPAAAVPGAIGQPGTVPLMGNKKFEFGVTSGIRPSIGFWLTQDETVALEFQGLVLALARAREQFYSNADGSPNTYIPFQLPTNVESALPFTVPGRSPRRRRRKANFGASESNLSWRSRRARQHTFSRPPHRRLSLPRSYRPCHRDQPTPPGRGPPCMPSARTSS